MRTTKRHTALVFAGLLAMACSSATPSPQHADPAEQEQGTDEAPRQMGVSSEIGALDEGAVDKTFRKSVGALRKCLNDGAERVEFIGGDVSFYVEVDAGGSVSHAYLEQSSLGDRDTERCMLDVLKAQDWPKPVGGERGFARKSFSFDPPNDVRPPTEWSSNDISDALGGIQGDIDGCKNGSSGTYQATMYVGTEGEVLGVGVTPPDENGEATVDCLVAALRTATYPSPGSWPAKVSFSL